MLAKYKRPLAVFAVLLALFGAYELYTTYVFYRDLNDGRQLLSGLENRVDLEDLNMSQAEAMSTREDFRDAQVKLSAAQRHMDTDPMLNAAKLVPVLGKQVKGLDVLVDLGAESSRVGYDATDVLLAYANYQGQDGETAIQSGLDFLESQAPAMQKVDQGLQGLLQRRADLPSGLMGPLQDATVSFDNATGKLQKLVNGYNEAYATLPTLLGADGPHTYLVLPQNDAELMPSGGLMSSYGIATFDHAQLGDITFEYFGTLFDRWQQQSGGEYVAPPAPLKNYLLRNTSWGLGEAGWYPDFPTTAGYASMFVEKGGAPTTDGVIALDQQFVQGLLDLVGPVDVPEYGVTIDSSNLIEKTLELTRDDQYEPNVPKKAFLSYLAHALLNKVFATPKDDWVAMLKLFGQEARERHLQLYFNDPKLEALISEYGFDGSMVKTDGDYVMLADASVNSTKLNIVLQNKASIDVQLNPDGTADTTVTYTIDNPYDQWKIGRDPHLMAALMLDGVYGSYTRVYAPTGSRLIDVKLDGQSVGAEQVDEEVGKQAFGRFFPVLPGQTRTLAVTYRTPVVVKDDSSGSVYDLYVQKEAGMRPIPLTLTVRLPNGGRFQSAALDGVQTDSLDGITTNLDTDHTLQVRFVGPGNGAG